MLLSDKFCKTYLQVSRLDACIIWLLQLIFALFHLILEYSGTIYSVKWEAYRFTSALDWGLDTDGYWPLKITVFRLRISCRYICDVDRFVYIQYVHNIIMWWIDVYNYKQALVRSICEINVNTVNCLMGAIDNVKKCKYLTINFCFYCISIVFKIFLLCLFDKFGFC